MLTQHLLRKVIDPSTTDETNVDGAPFVRVGARVLTVEN